MICPSCPNATFRGTASVAAPVLRRLAVSQLKDGAVQEKEKDNAKQRKT